MSIRRKSIYAVNVHAGVAIIHGLAHLAIPVNNSFLAWIYILSVIAAMPYLALRVMRSHQFLGSSLLALSMAGDFSGNGGLFGGHRKSGAGFGTVGAAE